MVFVSLNTLTNKANKDIRYGFCFPYVSPWGTKKYKITTISLFYCSSGMDRKYNLYKYKA